MQTEIIETELKEQGFKIIDKGIDKETENPYVNMINRIKHKPKLIRWLDNRLPYRILKRTTYSNMLDIKNTSEERFTQLINKLRL